MLGLTNGQNNEKERTRIGSLRVIYHGDFFIFSQYFYNDVLFVFNKEVEYFKNQKMYIYMTDHIIAYSKKYYSGMDITKYIEGGIKYEQLYEPSIDNLVKRKCCARVELIINEQKDQCEKNQLIYSYKYQQQPYCLRLVSENQYLYICDQGMTELEKIRNLMGIQILKHKQLIENQKQQLDKKNGDKVIEQKSGNYFLLASDLQWQQQQEKDFLEYSVMDRVNCGQQYQWSMNRQSRWECQCQYGKLQSPININIRNTIDLKGDTQLMLAYNQDLKQVKVRYEYQNVFIYGLLGRVQHKYKDQIIIYHLYKYGFKFPAEHQIDFIQAFGEVQIYGRSVDNQEIILSVLMNSRYGELPNKLFNNLNIELWPPWVSYSTNDNDQQEYSIQIDQDSDKHLGLNQLTAQQKNWQSSFYWYQGSYSQPDCKQGVHRVVFQKPIDVNSLTLQALKKYSFNSLIYKQGNNRKIQDFRDQSRIIYYHQSVCEPIDEDFYKLSDEKLQFRNTQLYHINQRITKFFRTNLKQAYEGDQEGGEAVAGVHDHKARLRVISEDQAVKEMKELPPQVQQKMHAEDYMMQKILAGLQM